MHAALVEQLRLARQLRRAGNDQSVRARMQTQLRQQQRATAAIIRHHQRVHEKEKFAGIEQARKESDRTFYKRVRAMTGKGSKRQMPARMQRPAGGMTATREEADAIWTSHYQAVSSVHDDDPAFEQQHLQDVRAAVREEAARPSGSIGPLDGDISLTEVRAALAAAHSGRAAGPDGFTIDMLKQGEAVMLRALHLLLQAMWRAERVPDAWLLAYLMPLHKGEGPRVEANSYRPIALMASVMKLYEAVLHERLTAHVDSTNAIGDEQAGFRRGRSCIDHVFVLTEAVAARREQGKHTYLCYIDISKAYDTTWRDGVWKRLLEIGVRGKAWRVIRDMYRRVSSSVVLDEHITAAFDTEEGLRQGSVLSPLLFSIFLADVIAEWRRQGIGVEIGGRKVGGLLFADDIVLIAKSAEDLHRAMNVMSDHARRWRYRFNTAKCAVVVAGMQKKKQTGERWLLSGEPVQEVEQYKYLGLQLQKNGRWTSWQEARVRAGRASMSALWWGGARRTGLPVATGERLIHEMLLPTLNYGSEVVTTTKQHATQLETVQAHAGCQLLGLPRVRTSYAMVRGELGWIRMSARRDMAQLRFLQRLHAMPATSITRAVYDERRAVYDKQMSRKEENKKKSGKEKQGRPQYGFCKAVQATLSRYRLQLPPITGAAAQAAAPAVAADASSVQRAKRLAARAAARAKRQWTTRVDAAIMSKEMEAWAQEVRGKSTGKMPWYAAVKEEWGREKWLGASSARCSRPRASSCERDGAGRDGDGDGDGMAAGSGGVVQTSGRRWRARMRCSSGLPLAAVLHAENASLHPSPLCTMCHANVSETPAHTMMGCSRWAVERAKMEVAMLASVTAEARRQWREGGEVERTVWCLNTSRPPVMRAVDAYLHAIFKARAAVVAERAAAAAVAAAAAEAARPRVPKASRTAAVRRQQRQGARGRGKNRGRVDRTAGGVGRGGGVTIASVRGSCRRSRDDGSRGRQRLLLEFMSRRAVVRREVTTVRKPKEVTVPARAGDARAAAARRVRR